MSLINEKGRKGRGVRASEGGKKEERMKRKREGRARGDLPYTEQLTQKS